MSHVEADLSTPDKQKQVLEHQPNAAEVIELIEAHFQTITVPMVKVVCENIDDLLPAHSPSITA